MAGNDNVVNDYLQRACLRRQVLPYFFERGSWPDVVRDSRMIVDLTMMAALFNAKVPVPGEAVAVERLPTDNLRNAGGEIVQGIGRLLDKERGLATAAVGTIAPSDYYSEADARSAIEMTDRVLHIFVPHLAPDLLPMLEESQPQRTARAARH